MKETIKLPWYLRPIVSFISLVLLLVVTVFVLIIMSCATVIVPFYLLFFGNITLEAKHKEDLEAIKIVTRTWWNEFKLGR